MKKVTTLYLIIGMSLSFYSKTIVNINLNSIETDIESKNKQGVFYVPKTSDSQIDFLNNGIRQNSIRLNIIEGTLIIQST